MSGGHTPGPWVAHGAFYTHGVKGDVFAKDARDVYDATPVCRVVAPVSHRQSKNAAPIDALHATARRKEQAPIIEANARLIAAAPELLEALEEVFADQGKVHSVRWTDKVAAAIAKARGSEPQP